MKIILLANTNFDWLSMAEYGLATMVIAFVLLAVLKPMVNQMIKSNAEFTKTYLKLVEALTVTQSLIKENSQRSEARMLQAFNALIEPLTVIKENVRDNKVQLDKIEGKISAK